MVLDAKKKKKDLQTPKPVRERKVKDDKIEVDGVVTEAEFRAFTRQVHTFSTPTFTAPETPQVPTIASFFLAVDTDGSGAVSRAELELFSHSMPIQSNFSAVDTDGSNSVSQAELLAHLNALASVVTSTHSSMLAGIR